MDRNNSPLKQYAIFMQIVNMHTVLINSPIQLFFFSGDEITKIYIVQRKKDKHINIVRNYKEIIPVPISVTKLE